MNNPANTAKTQDHIDTQAGYTKNPFSGQLNNFAVEPDPYPQATRRLGFTTFAERVNGRAAMIGFASLMIIEVLTGQSLMSLISSL